MAKYKVTKITEIQLTLSRAEAQRLLDFILEHAPGSAGPVTTALTEALQEDAEWGNVG